MEMQKKNKLPDTSASSSWQENVKKQQVNQSFKKYIIWTGIIAVCVVALVGLVYFANKSTGGASVAGQVEPNLPKVTSEDIIVGNAKASETIVEYADVQCPACAAYNPVVNQVLDNYNGKVRLVYRFFPLPQHQNAVIGAQSAYAAWKLGKFAQMKDKLYDTQADWGELPNDQAQAKFLEYAKSLGMDQNKFKNLMGSQAAKDFVQSDNQEASSLGLNSTPTFFLQGRLIVPQGLSDFKTLIDADLKNK